MTTSQNPRTTPPARASALALALALALLAPAGSPASARPASPDDVIWLKAEIHDESSEHVNVKISLPLSLIEVVVESIDKREFMAGLEQDHPSLNLQKLWREVRDMKGEDFVTIEADEDMVRVWKDRDFFRVDVREGKPGGADIDVRIPLEIMDYLFESKGKHFDFQDLVDRLRGHLPLTMVELHAEGKSVMIWLEKQ